jgi:hypothetical protein
MNFIIFKSYIISTNMKTPELTYASPEKSLT